jgi:hypothetical protein
MASDVFGLRIKATAGVAHSNVVNILATGYFVVLGVGL